MARTLCLAMAVASLGLLAAGASADPPTTGATPTPGEPAAVSAARAKDFAAYEAQKEALHRDADGSWVVIADGKVAAKGKALDDVKSVQRDAAHRFVFQVGDDGDQEEYITTWYAARFAGLALPRALGLRSVFGAEVSVEKDSVTVTAEGKSPFPRFHARIASPDGKPPAKEGSKAPELFLGTVGPALAMTPDDAAYLHLERWEVPGILDLGHMPCRRVLVTVSVVGIAGDAAIVAAYPLAPRERLVDLARWRGKFWQWGAGGPIAQMPIEGLADGEWIVFGNDRVLGHGTTPEDAVTDADPNTEFAYQRYLLQIPAELPPALIPVSGEVPQPHMFDLRKATKAGPTLNGRRVEARLLATEAPTYVVSSADAVALHLEMTESPFDARIVESDDPKAPVHYARVARAWTDLPVVVDGKPAGTRRGLALVVYERPKNGSDDPPPAFPGIGEPGMR